MLFEEIPTDDAIDVRLLMHDASDAKKSPLNIV